MNYKKTVNYLLNEAGVTGVTINDERFYKRVLTQGSLGLGESYMDGWWDAKKLDDVFYKLLSANLDEKVKNNFRFLSQLVIARVFNLQSKSRAFQVGEHHYDLGNDLFENMLDKRLTYTCGYWKNAKNLNQAQEAKLDLICRKLGLKKGQKVLDIGCGWGSFAKFAAEKYKVKVVGVTVSKEQVKLGRELCKGLPVEFRLQDYREVNEKFDYIVSVGMIEHVGRKNYREYMKVAHRNLKDDGLFLLHTIGAIKSGLVTDPWTEKYIFPNGMVPSVKELAGSIEGLFIMEDWHNFGADYDKTLMAWRKNFEKNWPKIKDNYSERFYRMWRYFLSASAGAFRSRRSQLWQIVFSKKGVPGGYQSIR